jgi:restriction endonuclease, S subunit
MRLEDICERGSSNLKQSDIVISSGKYPIYGASGHIGNVDFYHQDKPYVAVVKDGAGIGRTTLHPAKSSVIGTMQYLIPKKNVLPEYLYYVVRYMHLEKYFTGATIPHIYFKDYKNEQFNLDSLEKQEKIIGILGKCESLINAREKELKKLDKLIRARFVELFEEVKETCNVDYYIKELIAGKSLAGEVECKNKVLKTGAASFDHFDGSQVKNLPINYEPKEEHLVHKGDIIISRMNTAELTGAAAYVWKVSDNVYIPDRLWKALIRDGVNPIFLWNMLIQPSTKEQIQKVCSGTSGSMKNISKSGMLGIRVKKVDTHLQNDFATFVKQVNKSKLLVVSPPQIHIYKTLTLL